MREADVAWAGLAVAVGLYELAAPEGQLLSQACHRYRARHPVAVIVVVVYLAAHLLGVWPARLDPLHRIATRIGR